MAEYRNVWALIAAVTFLQLAGGILGVVTPLGLEALGVNAFAIGLIAASYAAGFMAGAWSAPAALASFGNIRVFSAAAAATAIGALVMQIAPHAAAWTAIRIIQGASFAWMFASAESWLAESTPAKSRGGVSGFYHLAAKAALLIGPFFAAGLPPLEARAYLFCGVFLAMALIPICLTRRAEPPPPSSRRPLPIRVLFGIAPAAVAGAFLAGVINTGTLALLPVFANRVAATDAAPTETAAVAMAAAWLGGLVTQWPAGRYSDRIDRRALVAVMAIMSACAALALGVLVGRASEPMRLALLALWGAGSLSFYSVCVAHAIDRSEARQIPQVMSELLFIWAVGSVLGPPLSGLAMRTPFGPGGLFIWAALLSILLAAAMFIRRSARAPVDAALREGWSVAQPTSVAGAEIDPRADPITPPRSAG